MIIIAKGVKRCYNIHANGGLPWISVRFEVSSVDRLKRQESDSVGTLDIPQKAYYGVQSLRGYNNFKISGVKMHPLFIKNVALIDFAEISFSEGLNVLSGETGAGKSVILDSVNFVLGAKADRTMIRYGETECMVKAEFSVKENAKALEILQDMDVESDEEIIISRKFSENGKNSIERVSQPCYTAEKGRKESKLYAICAHWLYGYEQRNQPSYCRKS